MRTYHSRTIAAIPVVVGFLLLLLVSPSYLPLLAGQSVTTRDLILTAVFGAIVLWLFGAAYVSVSVDGSDGLEVREGLSITRYPATDIEEALVVPTPRFPVHSGAARITLDRPEGPVGLTASYIWSMPWLKAEKSILILCRGQRSNFVLPHPDAEKIVSLVRPSHRIVRADGK